MNEQLSFFAADPRDVEAVDFLAGIVAHQLEQIRTLELRMHVLELAIARLANAAAPPAQPVRRIIYIDDLGEMRTLRVPPSPSPIRKAS